jgi:hypothetical protein
MPATRGSVFVNAAEGPGADGPGTLAALPAAIRNSSKSAGQLLVWLVNQLARGPEEFRVQIPAADAVEPARAP